VYLIRLKTAGFRNLGDFDVRFHRRTTAVLGGNGMGKTNLLEAIGILGNLRSFRTPILRQAAAYGETTFRLEGTISAGKTSRRLEQTVEVGPPVRRTLRVDGAEVSVQNYLQIYPVFSITTADRDLISGGPEGRRALLDRFVFLLKPPYLQDLRTYRRALRQRNAALAAGVNDTELSAWDGALAASAARVIAGRIRGAAVLRDHFAAVFEVLRGDGFPDVEIGYRTEPWWNPSTDLEKVEDLYRQRYNETRARDRQMGFTVEGPHRHDLSLRTDNRSVRHVLSSGQAKVVAAALKLAALAYIEKERSEHIPVIADDVDAELDSAVLVRLVSHLGRERQLFLSSTRDEIVETVAHPTRRIWLENGSCVRQEAETDE
jgi:DNA replication and repair protein RecF